MCIDQKLVEKSRSARSTGSTTFISGKYSDIKNNIISVGKICRQINNMCLGVSDLIGNRTEAKTRQFRSGTYCHSLTLLTVCKGDVLRIICLYHTCTHCLLTSFLLFFFSPFLQLYYSTSWYKGSQACLYLLTYYHDSFKVLNSMNYFVFAFIDIWKQFNSGINQCINHRNNRRKRQVLYSAEKKQPCSSLDNTGLYCWSFLICFLSV